MGPGGHVVKTYHIQAEQYAYPAHPEPAYAAHLDPAPAYATAGNLLRLDTVEGGRGRAHASFRATAVCMWC